MVDYLIIGQGIAGTILASDLLSKGRSVKIIDHYNAVSSSHISAGVINPVTGRRLVKSWFVDELLPEAKKRYQQLSDELDFECFTEMPIHRIATNQRDLNDWLAKVDNVFIKPLAKEDQDEIGSTSTGVSIHGGGIVAMGKLITALRTKWRKAGQLEEGVFNINSLKIHPDSISSGKVNAKRIIFCEGYQAAKNPLFEHLPFVLTKGELLTIKHSELPEDRIIISGHSIIPQGNGIFKVGATYDWDDISETTTDKAAHKILKTLEPILGSSYNVLDHHAGIRPTVKDRRPLVGHHPKYSNVWILNGMGSKGALLVPWLSRHLLRHIELSEPLRNDVNIQRFNF